MALQHTNSSHQAPNVCDYLCKMEHLEKPRAWYLNHFAEGWGKKSRGWDSGHQHKGGPGPKSVWSFLCGRKIRFVRAISSVWSLLRDISSPRLSFILRIPSSCLAEGKCGSNWPVLFHQSWDWPRVEFLVKSEGTLWIYELSAEATVGNGKFHADFTELWIWARRQMFYFRCSHCPLNGLFSFFLRSNS